MAAELPHASAAPVARAGDAAEAPHARWLRADAGAAGNWTLVLGGDWRQAPAKGRRRRSLAPWPELPGDVAAGAAVVVQADRLLAWDTELAVRLWELSQGLRERGAALDMATLPEGLHNVLALAALPRREAGESVAPPPPVRKPWAGVVTITFFGEVLLASARWFAGRAAVRRADVLHQLDECGPRSLPIVLLTCALLGLMLAYMGGAQLQRIGAQNFLADVVTVGMVREMAGLMTGIILAGRVGSAFAAQLATMKANEEVDALRVLGVEPIGHLVLPRLFALLWMAAPLYACGALVGILAGWLPAVGVYGVSHTEYLHQSLKSITFTHLWIGLLKCVLYTALVALAGCREGLHAGRSAQAVGEATTTAVVKALVWIVAAACATTVLFTSLQL
jgi:phospholipid/cholesterol/gamma-HCH transport system permease protein